VEGLGNFTAGDRVAILEDVITTGGSVLKACDRISQAGLQVVNVCAILDREEGGREKLRQAGYDLCALFTREELLNLAQ
jgi:orotate phosphoribosyltransferase